MKHIFVIVIVSITLISISCNNSESPTETKDQSTPYIDNHTYVNPQVGLSLTVPLDYNLEMNVNIGDYTAIVSGEKNIQLEDKPGFKVVSESSTAKPPITALIDGAADLLPAMLEDLNISEKSVGMLNGFEYGKIVYTFTQDQIVYKQEQIYYYNKMFIIVITFHSTAEQFEFFADEFDAIHESIELMP